MQQINQIKSNFEKWLERHVGENTGTLNSNQDLSIFSYAGEFKEYISDTYGSQDISMNLSDLLELEITDGKFVIPEELTEQIEADEPVESVAADETTPDKLEAEQGETDEQTAEIVSLLNNLFADADFKAALDANNDGELSSEEINVFINAISELDGEKDNITIEDILGGIQNVSDGKKIEDGQFKVDPADTTTEKSQVQAPQSTDTSYNPGSSSYNPSSGGAEQPKTKTLENMNASELQTELGNANKTLQTKQGELNQAIDGTTDTLKGLQENIDTAYSTYQEELAKVDEGMAEDVNKLKEATDKKQQDINENDKAIASQEATVSSAETAYNNAKTTRETLEASKEELKNTDTSEMSDEQAAKIAAKLSSIEGEIAAAKTAEENAKNAYEDAQAELDKLNGKKDELTNGEGGLTELQTQMTTLEGQIADKYPEMQQYIQAYNDAKAAFSEEQSKEISAAQTSVKNAQAYVNKVQTAISTLGDKELKKEYSAEAYDSEEGQRLVETAKAMLARYGSSTGYCAAGVSRTMQMAYGISMSGNGCDWDSNMDKLVQQGMFMEVTSDYPSSNRLGSLPAGAVVCWEATTGTGGGGAQYGHVTIADGHGGEISDHYASHIYQSIGGRSDQYRIFIPV